MAGDPTVSLGHWSAPYFDEGAGNIHMVTYSAIITIPASRQDLSDIGGFGADPTSFFWGIATIDVPIGDLIHWQPFHLDSSVHLFAICGMVFSLVFSLVCSIFIGVNRTTSLVKSSSWHMLNIILLGTCVTSASSILFVVSLTDLICATRVWALSLGVLLMFVPLFLKTYSGYRKYFRLFVSLSVVHEFVCSACCFQMRLLVAFCQSSLSNF